MGLDVVVGVYGEFAEDECAEFAEDFTVVRRELRAAGLPEWQEPQVAESDVVVHDMFGYSGLHHLRRLAAHLAASGTLPPPAEERPADDPVLRAAYATGPALAVTVRGGSAERTGSAPATPTFDHLIHHSDCEGYYVPSDFAPVLVSEDILGGYVGSSQRLLEECLRVAEALELPIDLEAEAEEVRRAVEGTIDDPAAWQRYGIASMTCLQLVESAWHSIDTGAAIAFC